MAYSNPLYLGMLWFKYCPIPIGSKLDLKNKNLASQGPLPLPLQSKHIHHAQ